MDNPVWLSLHFYPLETQDVFLARALRPFLAQNVWNTPGARFFFIRFEDEKGPHLRLRFRGEPTWLQETLLPAFETLVKDRGSWNEVPYDAESDRFGGEEAMAWAEEHFHLSARVVLDRLAQPEFTYGDALYDALRLNAMMLHAAGFNRERAAWYFGQLTDQWLPLFFRPEKEDKAQDNAWMQDVREQFEQSFQAQEAALRPVMDALWDALQTGKSDAKQPEWRRWHMGNEMILAELGDNLERALPSLIHLSNNRLGVTNPDEVFVCYVLSRAL
ncbi:MAG: thiopeptide-type bacteriocin biosynthesis protein [Saprospiraceae bacterium]|nr:thiopeptide-type bacteriocin biosynthesis protein [Saprospiraceae bacterium]